MGQGGEAVGGAVPGGRGAGVPGDEVASQHRQDHLVM